ncbi:HD-GYP domain-containing protein [Shinella sp. 838]|uniref:HD-GYP domain-containing protein n=1 Tax=unclassified Shinella TaxID=2643062 RepID=UPI000437B54E|nr:MULTISPECIES: HD-GYP domain-containing protein [unclassified Shinella]EYR80572.1 cyclic di-GMP phosphodiesterase response regulator RpfG [Shinella sp. DD12]MDG4669708.1 HD-GYP domain-containing protein [Shinella sp. 838]
MVRRIAKHLVRKGMFVESLECPNAEFSGRRFLVQSDETVRAILATSAAYALINPQKSTVDIDLATGPAPATQAAEERKRTLETVAESARSLRTSFDAARTGQLEIDALSPVADEISERIDADPDVFLKVTRLKTKDEGTYVHSLAVSALMMRLARLLDHDDSAVRELGVAGLLHDVGKLMIPNTVLNKSGRLDSDEKRLVRGHPELGYRLLKEQANVSDLVLDICRYHHETLDGSGYPLGLKADKLSQEIRIATICDVFEALTSTRPYKRPWTTRDALNWMFDRGHLFDKKLVIRLGSIFA